MLQWALEQGCPCDAQGTCRAAVNSGNEDLVRWMEEEGLFDKFVDDDEYSDDDDYDFYDEL